MPGQEVLTGDGLSVRLTLLARLEITDPRAWHEAMAAPLDVVYAAVQIAARHAVAARTLDELLAARTELAVELVSAVAAATADLGATVADVTVKDLMIPAELRRAATELAMSRAQGQAALERARSEVAAVRALTNAAKMVSDNPALLQLRTSQAVEAGRATVVLTQEPYARGVVAGGVEPQSTL
ncbi:MAG: hypothetical protein JWL64_2517 [Frankiales bacterium]|nr:hypothetical protein [Frankiales bacterium]